MSDAQGSVWYATQSDVAVVHLNRPPVNAIDLEMVGKLGLTLDELAHKRGLRGVVLAGTGVNFAAGLDTKAVPTYSADQLRELSAAINRVVLMLYGSPLPTVAAIAAPRSAAASASRSPATIASAPTRRHVSVCRR